MLPSGSLCDFGKQRGDPKEGIRVKNRLEAVFERVIPGLCQVSVARAIRSVSAAGSAGACASAYCWSLAFSAEAAEEFCCDPVNSVWEIRSSSWMGTDTTLGIPHAVEIRISR